MKDLIAKLEAATEGSRKLDAAIQYALTEEIAIDLPRYTTSIDAALSLVPDGVYLDLLSRSGKNGNFEWDCTLKESALPYRTFRTDERVGKETGPLALCIAALKARSHD